MQMRSEFDMNLTSQPSFRSDIRKCVEQSWTAANNLLQICDVNIRIRIRRKYEPGFDKVLIAIRYPFSA